MKSFGCVRRAAVSFSHTSFSVNGSGIAKKTTSVDFSSFTRPWILKQQRSRRRWLVILAIKSPLCHVDAIWDIGIVWKNIALDKTKATVLCRSRLEWKGHSLPVHEIAFERREQRNPFFTPLIARQQRTEASAHRSMEILVAELRRSSVDFECQRALLPCCIMAEIKFNCTDAKSQHGEKMTMHWKPRTATFSHYTAGYVSFWQS